MSGFIGLHRNIMRHWIWESDRHFKWWATVLLNVNHSPKKFPVGNNVFTCNPGGSFMSLDSWTALFKCSKKTTVKFFEMLESEGMITRETLGSGNQRKHLLTVVNWGKYQQRGNRTEPAPPKELSANNDKESTENSTERVLKTPPKGHYNKNDNKNKKENITFSNTKENPISGESEALEKQLEELKREIERIKKKQPVAKFTPPTAEQVEAYANEKSLNIDPAYFVDFYTSKDWKVGSSKMKDWKAAARNWSRNNGQKTPYQQQSQSQSQPKSTDNQQRTGVDYIPTEEEYDDVSAIYGD